MFLRTRIAILFLALQAVLVLRAQFVDARDFCWAPHTTQVRYSIETVIDGKPLTEDEIARRYRIPAEGWDGHSWRNVAALRALVLGHPLFYFACALAMAYGGAGRAGMLALLMLSAAGVSVDLIRAARRS